MARVHGVFAMAGMPLSVTGRSICRSAAPSATGNGHREAGIAALDVFSEWKSIYVDFSGRLQRAQIDIQEV